MNLKEKLAKKLKYTGKPYKSEDEEQAYKKAFKDARKTSLKSKAIEDAKLSIKGGSKLSTVAKGFDWLGKHAGGGIQPNFEESDFDGSGIMPNFTKKKRRK